ncbi:MAG: UDP-2,3-diacylglucosamine diphosphatase [Pseudomonadales bacterium]|nr:UDP-2,3-diacylglucosamine diphosphatase [Pseudomonadales bacterium]
MKRPMRCRSIFISDVHLGTSDCQAELLLDFLESTSCENLYLVGDIVDLYKLRNAIYWPRIKNEIANSILEKARSGTRVIYIPGNHDELLRDFVGSHWNGIDVKMQDIHTTAAGQRLLVLHGDVYDDAVRNMRWLEMLGGSLYELIMIVSRIYNRMRKRLGYPYWSFAAFIKTRFKEAVRYIERFEATAARDAAERGYDGIVCGHIHSPSRRVIDGTLYLNTGDWVEHCTALIEDERGGLVLIDWARRVREPDPRPAAVPDRQAA